MRNRYSYANEKLQNALRGMATSPESLQNRIRDAFSSNFIVLKADDFPEDCRYKFKNLYERITREPAIGDEGTIAATTNVMSDHEAVEIAIEIASLADGVRSAYLDD